MTEMNKEKVTVKTTIYYGVYEWSSDRIPQGYSYEPKDHEFILFDTVEQYHDVPMLTDFEIKQRLLALLLAQKEKAQAAAQIAIETIDKEIQSLMALTVE